MPFTDERLAAYDARHRHPLNRALNAVCAPLVYGALLAMLSALPSYSLFKLLPVSLQAYAHFGTLLLPFAILYYLRLSVPLALGMLAASAAWLWGVALFTGAGHAAWPWAFGLWAAARTLQWAGQRIEKTPPLLFGPLSYVLTGPAWALAVLCRKLHWPV
jgi:uncharacterized membrane protein YGL010W